MRTKVKTKTRGQTLVEFALVLPVFILLTMIMMDFGRAVWYANAISNAAREGARKGIIMANSDEVIRTTVKEKAAGVALTDTDISITARSEKEDFTVGVTYQFTPVTPLIGSFLPGGALTLGGSSTMRVEWSV